MEEVFARPLLRHSGAWDVSMSAKQGITRFTCAEIHHVLPRYGNGNGLRRLVARENVSVSFNKFVRIITVLGESINILFEA